MPRNFKIRYYLEVTHAVVVQCIYAVTSSLKQINKEEENITDPQDQQLTFIQQIHSASVCCQVRQAPNPEERLPDTHYALRALQSEKPFGEFVSEWLSRSGSVAATIFLFLSVCMHACSTRAYCSLPGSMDCGRLPVRLAFMGLWRRARRELS